MACRDGKTHDWERIRKVDKFRDEPYYLTRCRSCDLWLEAKKDQDLKHMMRKQNGE